MYCFGTKKTNIKLEKGLLKVRVGGGYLSIEEFVDQYLPIEYEKMGFGGFEEPVLQAPASPKRNSSPGRGASPNTRKSTQIRQSVSISNLKYNKY